MLRPLKSRHAGILKAVWSGAAARVLASGVTLISLPLAVRYLGPERYGLWVTITTMAVWVNLLDLGIANTLTSNISRAYALDDRASAARYITNALALTTGIAACLGLIFGVSCAHINWNALFNVSANVPASEVRSLVFVSVGLMLLGLPANLGSRILAGYQELHRNNFAVCAGALASLAGLATGILLGVSMPVLFVMSVGCLTLANLVSLALTIGWHKPWLLPRPSLLDGRTIRQLFVSGSSFFSIQVAAAVVFSSDNLIVSHYLGASEVTPYSVSWRLVGLSAVLQSLIFPALWPAYAEAHARGEHGWIRRTFTLTMAGTLAFNLVCALVLVTLGRPLIQLWAGPAAVPQQSLLVAMGVWAVISGFMTVESCLLAALNQTREQAVLSVVAAVLNIMLSIVLVRHIGSLGVIAGTILSYLLVLVVPQSMIVHRLLREGLAPADIKTNAKCPVPGAAREIVASLAHE